MMVFRQRADLSPLALCCCFSFVCTLFSRPRLSWTRWKIVIARHKRVLLGRHPVAVDVGTWNVCPHFRTACRLLLQTLQCTTELKTCIPLQVPPSCSWGLGLIRVEQMRVLSICFTFSLCLVWRSNLVNSKKVFTSFIIPESSVHSKVTFYNFRVEPETVFHSNNSNLSS